MKVYIVKYYSQDGKESRRVLLKMNNDFTGEEVFFGGFLREPKEQATWGKKGWLESYAEIYKEKPLKLEEKQEKEKK